MKPGSFVIGEDGKRKPNMKDEAMKKRTVPAVSAAETVEAVETNKREVKKDAKK